MTLSRDVSCVCATFSAVLCRRVALLMLSAGGASAAAAEASATIRSIVRFYYGLLAAMSCLRFNDTLYAKIQ